MATDLKFVTAISTDTTQGFLLRGRYLTELIGEADFVGALYLSLTGKQPTQLQTRLFNAVLVACLDHGLSPASSFVPRVAASSGVDALTALATTLLSLGPRHGAAVTGAMELFVAVGADIENIESAAQLTVDTYARRSERLPGFGHPKYTKADPRTTALFSLAKREGIESKYIDVARQIEHSIEEKHGVKRVLNIDGATAALLLAIEIDPLAGNAVFALARLAGNIAHVIEEQRANKGVRRVPEEDIEYSASR